LLSTYRLSTCPILFNNKVELIFAYGSLLHLHREGNLVRRTDGSYYDTDIDCWIPSNRLRALLAWEPVIFERLGWSMVTIEKEGFVTFVQLFSSLAHEAVEGIAPRNPSKEPKIDIYVLYTGVHADSKRWYHDLWQHWLFDENKMFPTRSFSLNSSATGSVFHVRVPSTSQQILDCLYGDWNKSTPNHAAVGGICGIYPLTSMKKTFGLDLRTKPAPWQIY
jgi:hypothetical protein